MRFSNPEFRCSGYFDTHHGMPRALKQFRRGPFGCAETRFQILHRSRDSAPFGRSHPFSGEERCLPFPMKRDCPPAMRAHCVQMPNRVSHRHTQGWHEQVAGSRRRLMSMLLGTGC